MNLYTALRAGFPADLDATAIDAEGALYSWRDLERGSAMLANWLERLDLPAGSRIAAHTDKSVEALLLYLAVLRAGFVYLPLNPAYQAGELEHFIGDAAPGVVVCAGRNFGWVSKLAFQRGVRWVFTLNDDRSGTLLDRAMQMSDMHEPVARASGDLAAILYTSGTTGRSKGAMLSHGNLLSNAQTLKGFWDWQPDDVLLHALPIFHVHGLFVASHGALLNGSRMLWFNRFDAAAVARRLPEASVFMGVPTLYVRLLQEKALDCGRMRLFISGSAPLLIETWRDWQARTGHMILERYGMSETLMLTSNPCRPGDGEQGRRIGGTVGPALPGVGLRIVRDDGGPCPTDEIGHVQVRGPSVFAGYWQMPEKTAEEFTADGWFKTGDVGRVGANGYLTLIGRSKDLIISGGFNVYPAEIEGLLNELPGVGESAVIGVPHPDFGEAVVAVVTPRGADRPDPEVLIRTLKARIAGFKVPKRVIVTTELPRNAMGKVQKKLLREQQAGLFLS
ncbi:malonyl-CoA synthase [Roseateles sp.]|uniref:malonate--CoA ligase n=1 Tax=Roseateles sp. TaxID=1971397 RepID=UPI0025ED65E3|nr:malonyl-CoA synthase [Roseateles sp.]MBV8036436.1 malonyl-CoA synthase [Roseateles sp.]